MMEQESITYLFSFCLMSELFPSLLTTLENIGIVPQDISLYQTACIHRSFLNEAPKGITSHNERLEFL